MEKIIVAVTGCGAITRNTWAPDLASHPRVQDTLFHSRTFANAQAMASHFGGSAYQSLEALVRQSPRAAVIAASSAAHKELALALLSAGIEVLVEKPLTLTLADAIDVYLAARRHGLRLQQPYHQLLMARQVLDELSAGLVGIPYMVDYRWLRKTGDTLLEDLGPHGLAFILAIAGQRQATRVTAVSGFRGVDVAVEYPGLRGTVQLQVDPAMQSPDEVSACIHGTRGTIKLRFRTTLTPDSTDCRPIVAANGRSGYLQEIPPIGAVRREQAHRWVDSLLGGPPLPVTDLECLRIQALLDAALLSQFNRAAAVAPEDVSVF